VINASEPHNVLPIQPPNVSQVAPVPNAAWLASRETHGIVFRIDRPAQPHAHTRGPVLPQVEPERQTQRLLEAFVGHTQAVLRLAIQQGWAVHPTISRLVALGFEPSRLCDLGLGLFSTPGEVRRTLLQCGFSISQIRAVRILADARLPGRLVGPVFDAQGQIHSLWAWNPQLQRPRYLYLRRDWQHEVALLGLFDTQSPASTLLVVEDLLDEVYLRARGFTATAAIGGPVSRMTFSRWQMLSESGVRRVILAPCWSRQASEIVWETARQAAAVRPSLDVYVLGAEALGTAGPAELVRQQGTEALWRLLRHVDTHRAEPAAEPAPAVPGPAPEPVLEETPLPCPDPQPSLCELPTEAETPTATLAVDAMDVEPEASEPPSPALPEWCHLHDCRPTDCFCFD